MKKPLEGVRIIEIGPLIAVPMCGGMLGSLGAEVIKVETNRSLDIMYYAPAWGPGQGRPDLDCYKRRITMDLSRPEAPPIFKELLKASDVLLTNMGKEALEEWGLDELSLEKIVSLADCSGFLPFSAKYNLRSFIRI